MTPLWLRRLLCWITGGHRYADENIETLCSSVDEIYFTNHCVKCGTEYLYEADFEKE